MLDSVKDTIRRYNMLDAGEQVVTALSGGADSVSLALALKKLGYRVSAVHVNHHLRGEESDRDMHFCEEFCERHGIKLEIFHVDVEKYACEKGLSTETAARELRYGIFESLPDKLKIATAHTADDCFETALFNFSRGTGIKGLCGVPPVREGFVRPLVNTTRKQVEAFLEAQNESFVTDSTNLETDCSRNVIRHLVVPNLRSVNSNAVENYARARENLKNDSDFLEAVSDDEFKRVRTETDGTYDVSGFGALHNAIKRRVIAKILEENGVEISQDKIFELENICENGGKINPARDLYFECKNNLLKASQENTGIFSEYKLSIEVAQYGAYDFFDRKVSLRLIDTTKDNVNDKFTNYCMDCDKIKGLIVLRNRHEGDRIRLAKRDFTSSVKKLFNQAFEREKRGSRVILEDDEGLIFVEKFGVADRVKADEKTEKMLVIDISDE